MADQVFSDYLVSDAAYNEATWNGDARVAPSKNTVRDVVEVFVTAIATKQPLDATLTALAAFNTNGLLVQTAQDTFTGRTLTGTANEVEVAKGDGADGNPVISLPDRLDLGGKISFEIPNSVAPEVDTTGEIALDSTVTDFAGGVVKVFSGELFGLLMLPIAQFTSPTNGDVPTYNSITDQFDLAPAAGGGGDALVANPLSQFAATTSAQLRSVLSDENGTGVILCDSATNPTLIGLINSAAGAASTPAELLSGVPFSGGTGTTTHPHLYLNSGTAPSSWSTNGTLIGGNAPSGFTGNFFDVHLNGGASLISMSYLGTLNCGIINGSNILAGATNVIGFATRSRLSSSADGKIRLQNGAGTDFTSLHFGLLDATRPSLKVTGTSLGFRLSDDSADSPMSASTGIFSSSLSATALTLTTTPLPVTSGGIGVATLTQYGVVLGNGTSAVAVTAAGAANHVLTGNGSANPTFQGTQETFFIALSDKTTTITTGTNKGLTFEIPYAFTVTGVSLTVEASSGTITMDVNEGGVTILSTKLTLDSTELTSNTAAVPPVISDASLAAFARITADVDAVTGTLTGLCLAITGYRT